MHRPIHTTQPRAAIRAMPLKHDWPIQNEREGGLAGCWRTCAVKVHGAGDNDTKPANASGACEWAGTVGRQEWVCVLGQGWLPPLQAGMAMGSNS